MYFKIVEMTLNVNKSFPIDFFLNLTKVQRIQSGLEESNTKMGVGAYTLQTIIVHAHLKKVL